MADWTILNGERRANDDDDEDDEDNDEDEHNAEDRRNRRTRSPSQEANRRGNLSRQRSRESPSRGRSLSRSKQRRNEDLVRILASEESLVPASKLGYENDLALAVQELNGCGAAAAATSDSEVEPTLDESSRILDYRLKANDAAGRLEESGAKIRREARQELLQERQSLYGTNADASSEKLRNMFNGEKKDAGAGLFDGANGMEARLIVEKPSANGSSPTSEQDKQQQQQQHHVQFNRKLLNGGKSKKENGKSDRASPSISTSSSSSSSEDNSSLDQLTEARAPDGGYGWVVVAAAFMVNLIADGITFSFGVIYHEFLKYFGEGKATTSWIGSLFMAMPLLSGPIASFLTDRYGCRRVTIAGSILATTGFVISYFATSLEMLVLTFGVLAGFGLSLCFVAAVVIVAYYFEKRRSFATGLSVCGSGIGTFIFPPLIQRLLEEYGWRGTTLILSGLFLNLAVCGGLMRDLEWTKPKSKAQLRRQQLERKQRLRMQSSSADSFSASSSANTAQTLQLGHGPPEPQKLALESEQQQQQQQQHQHQLQQPDSTKLFSSLVSLPTFVKNGEKVPLEVLELLSAKKNVYNVLIQNYPSLLISSRSFSDSSGLHEPMSPPSARFVPVLSPLVIEDAAKEMDSAHHEHQDERPIFDHQQADWWLRNKVIDPTCQLRRSSASEPHPRRFTTAYLKDIRMHRHSLTYRGAMLNINRYRLRASSCPDILRNSMTTIAKDEAGYAGLREFKDLIVNIFDLTHFREPVFTLFAISNFLLHTWYDVPYMYLTDNAIEVGFSETEASYLISIIGIMNMAGEILLGWAGDRACINASVVYAICMALTGGFAALIPTVIRCYYLLSAIAGAFGFFIAANYSLTSIILVEAITIERFTNAYGLLLFVQGIANLMGPPIAGWLYDITGSYDLSFYLAGGFIALSGAMLLVKPLIKCYAKLKEKAAARRRAKAHPARPDFTGDINSV